MFASCADTACAETWINAGTADGGTQIGTVRVSVDVDSIVRRGDLLRYRSYWSLESPARADDGRTFTQVLAEHDVRCADYVRYNNVVRGYDDEAMLIYFWEPIARIPSPKFGSPGEVSARIVCGR
jgi:hypothetical protein